MPRAPEHLRHQWADDTEALDCLARVGVMPWRGILQVRPSKWQRLTARERSAIDYLVLEWDYGAGWVGTVHPLRESAA